MNGLSRIKQECLKFIRNPDFKGIIIVGGFIGAIAVSFFIILLDLMLRPALLNDGQYIFTFIVTCPVGWLIGASIGFGAAFVNERIVKPNNACILGILIIIGGCIGSVITGPQLIGYLFMPFGLILELLGVIS